MINYEWNITDLGLYPSYEEQSNVVYQIHWRLQATEIDDSVTYFSEIYGVTDITVDVSETFTPFEQLTKEQVVSWLEAAMGEEDVNSKKSKLALDIYVQRNPQVITSFPPWA